MGTFETTTTTMASAMTSTSAFTPTTAGLKARRANKTFSRSTVRVQARKPLVGYEAPDFSAEAVFDQEFQDIKLSDYRGKYVVLFFYPLDFTFVCPTEITAFSDHYEEFAKLNTEVLGCSVDSKFSHLAWLQTDRLRRPLRRRHRAPWFVHHRSRRRHSAQHRQQRSVWPLRRRNAARASSHPARAKQPG